MSDHRRRMQKFELGLINRIEKVAVPLDVGITFGQHSLAQWLAHKYNHNFDEYDKAIDAVYNQTHIGGSAYHHLLDGQHSFLGAFNAVSGVHADDSFVQEISQAGEHLLRDTMSVGGINPFLSFSTEQFNHLTNLASQIGISKPFLADALTINGPELMGGTIALVASLILGKNADPSKLSALSGAYLTSAFVSANPLLLPIAAGGLVHACVKADDKRQVIVQAGKGAFVSGSAILVGHIIGGPIWIGCTVTIGTAIAVRYGIDNPDKAFKRMTKLVDSATGVMRKVSLAID